MEKTLAAMKKCPLFAALSPETVRRELLPLGQLAEYPRGAHILYPQDRLDRLGIVLSGRLQILHLFEDGGDSLSAVLGPGGVLGSDLVATESREAPYHAVAATAVRLLYLPAECVLAPGTLPESTRLEILARLLTLISQENMKKEYRFAILSRKGLRERILTYLTMQANKRHTPTVTIPFSREEMASYLCVNRSALSHQLSLLRAEGVLDFRKNRFTLLRWHPSVHGEETLKIESLP